MLKEGIKLYPLQVIEDPNKTTDLEYVTRTHYVTEHVLEKLGFKIIKSIITDNFVRTELIWISPDNPDGRKIYISMVDNLEVYMKEFKELLDSISRYTSDNFKLVG